MDVVVIELFRSNQCFWPQYFQVRSTIAQKWLIAGADLSLTGHVT